MSKNKVDKNVPEAERQVPAQANVSSRPGGDRPATMDMGDVALARPAYRVNSAFPHEGKWYTRENAHLIEALPDKVRKHHEEAGHIVKINRD